MESWEEEVPIGAALSRRGRFPPGAAPLAAPRRRVWRNRPWRTHLQCALQQLILVRSAEHA